jgi:Ni2+-binding GTPase involved in maturation of urease and hydrogenase
VIERAYVHVAGPVGVGKTTFIEAVFRGLDRWWLAARCVRNDSLRRARETSAKTHPELRRYRQAGVTAAALFEFPEDDIGSDESS